MGDVAAASGGVPNGTAEATGLLREAMGRLLRGALIALLGLMAFGAAASGAQAQVNCNVGVSANAGQALIDNAAGRSACTQTTDGTPFDTTTGSYLSFAQSGVGGNIYSNGGTTNTTADDTITTPRGIVRMARSSGRTFISYTPSANANGTDSFRVLLGSGDFEHNNYVNYTVTIIPNRPSPNPLAATVAYGSSNNTLTPTYDTANNGPATSVAVVTGATNGTVTASGTNFVYTPNAATYGSDTFTFTASNAGGTSATQTATITIGEPQPTVTQLSPPAGPVAGGNSVVITGTNFARSGPSDKPTVSFGGTVVPDADVTYASSTSLTVRAPARPAGPTNVTVTNTANTSAATAANQYSYVNAPVANAQSVAAAFNATTAITLTASNAPTSYAYTQPAANSGTVGGTGPNVTYTPPANYSGTTSFTFTATNAGGTSAPATVTVTVAPPPVPAAPVVTAPANGAILATATATVTGTTSSGSGVAVYVDGALSGSARVSGSSFNYTTPALGQGSHTVYAIASNAGGASPQSNTNSFVVDTVAPAAPAIAAPANGSTTTSQQPTVTGTAEANSTVAVRFDTGASGTTTAGSSGAFSFAPTAALAYGARTVSATARDAAGNVGPVATSSFTIVQAPAVTGVTPNQGTTAGGQQITIAGSGFAGTDPATGVTVGGQPATGVTVSATSITATTPAGTAGATTVQVANAGGSSNSAYTYLAPPTATGASVTTAYQTARPITLQGTNATSYTYTQPAVGTGSVSGTGPNVTYMPPAGYSGTASFTFTATNGTGAGAPQSAPATITVTVAPAAPTVTTQPGDQIVAQGATATFTAAASGSPSVQWQVSNDGTNFTAIAGATSPSYAFTTTAADNGNRYRAQFTNAGGTTVSNAAALTVVQRPTANNQTISVPFETLRSFTLTGSDPQGRPLTFNVTSVAQKGSVAGTAPNLQYGANPNARGTDSFTFTVSNGVATSAPATITIDIVDPTLALSTPTATGGIGTAYASGTTASGGKGPYAFQLTGTLPPGLSFATSGSPTRTITGTPTTGGTYSFTVTTRDDGIPGNPPVQTSQPFTITIAKGAQTVGFTSTPPAGGIVGGTYAVTATASSGLTPVVTIDPSSTSICSISGNTVRFNQVGTCTIDANQAGDANYDAAPQVQQSVTVGQPTVVVAPPTTPNPQVGVAYTQTFAASGGTAPYAYTQSGALPTGLTFNAGTATLSGTPTQGGNFSYTITATDSSSGSGAPFSSSRTYSATVQAPTIAIAPATLPAGTGGVSYSQTMTASGGTPGYTFTTTGALPAGITLSSTGTLAGTPTQTGSFTFTVTAIDSSTGSGQSNGHYTANRQYTLTIGQPTIALAPPTLPAATVGAAYTQILTASGGSGSYAYTVVTGSGALPAGLTLATDGTFGGTPTAGGTFSFSVRATDSNGFAGTRTYSFAVAAATVAVGPDTLADATRGVDYTQTLTASGGTAPYAFTATGTLPPGTTLSSSGVFSGRPTAVGSFTFSVTARDASTGSGPYASPARSYTVAVTAPSITLNPTSLPAATTRVRYTQAITATGGAGSYGYAVTAGVLPAGVTLATDGTLSGTATTAGSYGFTITATDANGNTGNRPYTLAVAAPTITIAPDALPAATTRVAYSQALTASGGTGAYGYVVTAGALPSGITLAADGTLSGTTTVAGSYNVTVTATDANGNAGSRGYTFSVVAPAITLAPPTLPSATTRIAYSQTLTANGGTAPYSFSVTAGAVPAGVALAADGTLAGTPTAAGSFSFTVTATDANDNAAGRGYTLAVNAPAIVLAPATLPNASVGGAYSQAITASGGGGTFTYAVTAGALPAGITLSTSGMLSGTATAGGSFTFTATATDGDGNTGARAYTLTVGAATVTLAPDMLPAATTRIAYSQALTASGGTAPYAFSVTAGALPAGITLAANGTLAGTATVAGSYSFTVTARDSSAGNGPFSGSRGYTLVVSAPAITVAPATLPAATTRIAYSQALTASGGTAPYAFSVTAGALPTGVTLATDGTLAGTPTTAGSYNFTVTATDANGNTGTQGYTLAVTAPAIVLAPATLPDAVTGAAYSQAITASGGNGGFTYAVTAGALPAGITLSSGGVLTGTATAGGSFTFTVTATDSNGNTGARGYTIAVGAAQIAIVPTTLPAGQVRDAYSQTLTASSGTAPYTYVLTAGSPPAGLTLAANGTLAGTPIQSGSFTFTVAARDSSTGSGPYTGTRNYTLAIAAPALTLAPDTLPGTVRGAAYSQQLTATGGTAPYTYASTGALPPGLTLSTGGVLQGRATTAGSYSFTVTATDATTPGFGGPYSASRAYTVEVTAPTITLAPTTLPLGTTRIAYIQAITASGGTAPYAYTVTAGALPAGITLSASGTLSGTPTAAGTFNATITATDANGNAGSQAYALTVTAPTIALAPDTLPPGTTRIAYIQAITASGGTAPYAYTVTAGALPAGITLSASGTLSGTPSVAGTFNVTITATDANGNAGSQAYALIVTAPAITLAPNTLPAGTTRVAYRQAITATGGVGPYAYAVTAGTPPQGLTLGVDGVLAGTPDAAGSFAFTVAATDANGNGGSQAYTVTIAAPAIVLAPQTLPGATAGTAYAQRITATGGAEPLSFAVTAGALPTGVTLAADGTLSGTPTAGGSFPFTASATDANGNSGSRAYTLAVAAPTLALTPESLAAGQSGTAYSQALAATGGTAPYAYAVTAGRLPAGLTLSATGTLAGTPTQSGSFALTVTATDSSTGSGPYTASRGYTLVIAAPALALAPATLEGASVGTAYSATLVASGGTAPYGYRVTEGALPAGIMLSTDGTLSGTPTAGGSVAFTVTVTDATATGDGGPYSASRSYTLAVAVAQVAVAPEALPAAQQGVAYTTTVTATGGVAPYAFAVTGGRLPAGLTLAATGALSGTPTEAGRFPVSITATDSASGSGPYSGTRAYTLEVGAPRVPTAEPVSATVAYNSQNNPVAPVLDGGSATSVAVASQPQHGTATATGLRITYTPAPGYSGPDSFSYTAGNEGGNSAPATVSVTVAGPTVTITPAALPDARQGDAYSQQLTAAGGAAPYAFAVASGTLPAGLSLSPAGVLSGTPTAGGSATFTVRATDSSTGTGPFSATQAYTLAVALPAAPTIRTVPTIAAAGSSSTTNGSTDVVLSDYVSGNVSDIQVTSPPANGTVTVANGGGRIVATYVPRANYAGRDSFQVVAVGPGGRSAAATVTLQVAGTAPVVTALTAGTTQGVPVTVDLSAGATGGPFTAATVVAVSPAGQVTTQVNEGGTAATRTYSLTLAPLVSYSGTVTVTYTLSNQYGASRPATITLTVAARPDPSADPSVNALSAAQADATRRFVRGQVDNFLRRNERLHNGGTGTGGIAVGNTLGLGLGGLIQPGRTTPTTLGLGEMKTLQARGIATPVTGTIGGLPGMTDDMTGGVNTATGGTTASGTARAAPQAEGADTGDAGPGERRIGSVGIWSGGAVTVGAWDASTRRAKMAITTGGLSGGADIKLSDTLIVGAGGGYGHDATRIDGGKAHVRGDSWSVAGYGSWSPADGLFVDGVAGAGEVSFDTSRRVDATGGLALGDRDGRTIFGSLAAGFDRHGKRIDFSAYGRADYLSARLDRFTEAGAGIYDLTFGKRNLDSLTGVLGTRIALPMTGVTPRLRAEWRHEFADTGSQLVDYADVANLRYATRGDLWLRDAFTLDLGLDVDLGAGWGLTTELGGSAGSGAMSRTGRIGVRKQF